MSRTKQIGWILLCGAAGALAVGAGSLLIPDRYTSRARLRLTAEPFAASDAVRIAYQEAFSRQTLKAIIQRLNLYTADRERLPLEDVVDSMKKDDLKLDIQPDQLVRVSFEYSNAAGAQNGLNAVMQDMVAANRELRRREPGWGTLDVKDAASPGQAIRNAAFWRPARYVSKGQLALQREEFAIDQAKIVARFEVLRQHVFDPARLEMLIGRFRLYESLRDRGLFAEARIQLERDLLIENNRGAVTVTFTDSDAMRAQRVVNGVVTMLSDADLMLGCRPPSPQALTMTASAKGGCVQMRPEWERLDVLDPASLPQESDGPVRSVLAAYGFLLGVGLWTALKPS
ncbi:MAG TPA: hypothetical protein VGL72_04365 [Bryobacteraceae bacterium]|jgi:hypothetical protein